MKTTLLISLLSFFILASENKEETKVDEIQLNNACVKGLSANIRSEADIKSSIVINLPKYTPLTILEKGEKWSKVKSKNFEGWLVNELIVDDVNCVVVVQPSNVFENPQSKTPAQSRETVELNEGLRIIETQIGITKVQDKYGNTFWLENHNIWPKTKLENLSLSL